LKQTVEANVQAELQVDEPIIFIGYNLATFSDGENKGNVVGSGAGVVVEFAGLKEAVVFDFQSIVKEAIRIRDENV
jgi:acetoacetate decarboxylase